MGKVAAVLGGASGGYEELATLRDMADVVAVYAVNDAAADYEGELAAFVTLHPEKLPGWLAARRDAGRPEPREVIAHEQKAHVTRVVDYRWPGMTSSGSSGLFAAKIAMETQPYPVVLCGVPMDANRAHYFNFATWNDVNGFFRGWEAAHQFIKDRVRSMSGWTAEFLGRPTPEFLTPAGGMPVLNSERL